VVGGVAVSAMLGTSASVRSVVVSSYEMDFWQDCVNTHHEEGKQFVAAKRMGLRADWAVGHPPTYDVQGRSVIDIGGGPVSILLKCSNRGRAVVADPGVFPDWVLARYEHVGIEYWRTDGEDISGYTFDEAWIYNVLQHVRDPALVIERARELASTIRIFEWIDIDPYAGHPHLLTEVFLNECLSSPGFTVELNERGRWTRLLRRLQRALNSSFTVWLAWDFPLRTFVENFPISAAAIFTGIGGVMTAYAGILAARRRSNDECEQRVTAMYSEVKQYRDEAMTSSSALHRARRRLVELGEDPMT
jgi:hypothetical protein